MQSRRSLLIWKIYGKRLDGWDNDDLPYEASPAIRSRSGSRASRLPDTPKNRELAHIGYTGGVMPPPEAVAGTYVAPDGKIQVPGLTDEDRLTLVRWIDLGCPIDLSKDSERARLVAGRSTADVDAHLSSCRKQRLADADRWSACTITTRAWT